MNTNVKRFYVYDLSVLLLFEHNFPRRAFLAVLQSSMVAHLPVRCTSSRHQEILDPPLRILNHYRKRAAQYPTSLDIHET